MTRIHEQLEQFYTECMNCKNTCAQCPGIWKDIDDGVPPRGFQYGTAPVRILVVGKNPGHPLICEQEHLRGQVGFELFQASRNFQQQYYAEPNICRESSNRFHNNLFRYLRYFFELSEREIFDHIAITNLVKCSTTLETKKLHRKTMEECYSKYLLEEIRLLRPKVLLALGREVERFLLKKNPEHRLPVIYIKHPSYFYRNDRESDELDRIKAEIRSHLSDS